MPPPTPTPTPTPEPLTIPTPTPTVAPSAPPAVALVPTATLDQLDWYLDGLSGDENFVAREFRKIEKRDPSIAQAILGMSWFEDGIDRQREWVLGHEAQAILWMEALVFSAPSIAGKQVISLPWFVDGPVSMEENHILRRLLQSSGSMPIVELLMELSSEMGGVVDSYESMAFGGIYSLAVADLSLAEYFVGLPWVADGIDADEGRRIALLRLAGSWSTPESSLDFVLSFDPVPGSLDEGVLITLEEMGSSNYIWTVKLLNLLMTQPWIEDGLTTEEKAQIIALRSLIRSEEGYVFWTIGKELIEEGQVWSESSSSSEGAVNLFIVSRTSLTSEVDMFAELRTGIKAIERTARQASVTNVVLLVEHELTSCFPQYEVGRNVDLYIGASHVGDDAFYGRLIPFFRDLLAKTTPEEESEPEPEPRPVPVGYPVAETLAPMEDSLLWTAHFDNESKEWSVYDPSGTFTPESLPTPPGVPVPNLTEIGSLTRLYPGKLYWFAVSEDLRFLWVGRSHALTSGVNLIEL